MPRQARRESGSGYYHIMLRGINRQMIFFEDTDCDRFVSCIGRYCAETGIALIAYCLMDNHVHLLLRSAQLPDQLVKKIASSYVYYFNHKYDRQGHLFQDRYKSEVVEEDAYILTCARYIMRNPEKAGICRTEEYQWSTWHELKDGHGLCDTQILCDLADSGQALKEYILTPNDDICMELNGSSAMTDAKALRVFRQVTGIDKPEELQLLDRRQRDRLLTELKNQGVSVRQLSRITGIGRNIIQRADESTNLSP